MSEEVSDVACLRDLEARFYSIDLPPNLDKEFIMMHSSVVIQLPENTQIRTISDRHGLRMGSLPLHGHNFCTHKAM